MLIEKSDEEFLIGKQVSFFDNQGVNKEGIVLNIANDLSLANKTNSYFDIEAEDKKHSDIPFGDILGVFKEINKEYKIFAYMLNEEEFEYEDDKAYKYSATVLAKDDTIIDNYEGIGAFATFEDAIDEASSWASIFLKNLKENLTDVKLSDVAFKTPKGVAIDVALKTAKETISDIVNLDLEDESHLNKIVKEYESNFNNKINTDNKEKNTHLKNYKSKLK